MRYNQLLSEAQNYEDMFKKIKDAYTKLNLDQIRLDEQIRMRLGFARSVLKKSDRIIWYLRYFKIFLIMRQLDQEIYKNKEVFAELEQDARRTAAKANIQITNNYDYSPQRLESVLGHFLSLPISKIQNYRFLNQSYEEVLNQFTDWEEEWQQKTKGMVQPQEGDKMIEKFPDGYAWWLLSRGSCDLEAKAMGHCGNVPSEKYGDRILSFRKNVYEDFWEPHLTFILDKNGRLGESKGRGNNKPTEKYHPYIAKLLMKPSIIQGIKGGGYKPENNFKLTDLNDDLKEKVLEANPALENNLIILYNKEGLSPRVENSALDALSNAGIDVYSMAADNTTLIEYDDLSRFVRDMSMEYKPLDNAISFYENIEDQEDVRDIDSEELEGLADKLDAITDDYVDILQRLPDRYLIKIANNTNYSKSISNVKQLADFADHIEKSKYGNILRMAMIDATTPNVNQFDKDEFMDYVNMLLEIYIGFSGNHYAYIKSPIKNMDDTITIEMPTDKVIPIAYAASLDNEDSLDDGNEWLDDEEFSLYREIKYNNNWIYVDAYAIDSEEPSWLDEDQTKIYEKYKKMISMANIKDQNLSKISQNFDITQAAQFTTKYIDLNESINRIKKLSGILK